MNCPKCGAENPDYAFYCGKCAAALRSESESEAANDVVPQTASPISAAPKCPKCGNYMEEGFVFVTTPMGGLYDVRWSTEKVKWSFGGGETIMRDFGLPNIPACRCTSCRLITIQY